MMAGDILIFIGFIAATVAVFIVLTKIIKEDKANVNRLERKETEEKFGRVKHEDWISDLNCDNMSQNYDACLPELTVGSFCVKVNYANLSQEEVDAFVSGVIDIFYFKEESESPIIFIVFDFNGIVKFEVAINLQKLSIPLETWVNTKEETISLYLFERTTGSISGIRTIKLKYLESLKEELYRQEHYTSKQIDDEILSIRNEFLISDMIKYASAHEIIYT